MAFTGFGGFGGFGGTSLANQQAVYMQQQTDLAKARDTRSQIGYVPSGGPTNTHGNVHKAVNFGGARTFLNSGPVKANRPAWIEGLGVDLNGDGKFREGTDGQLALDLDGNGLYDRNDIKDTLSMLKLFSGDTEAGAKEPVAFGTFNQAETAKTELLRARGKQADLNQDGVLSGWELNKMGAKVLVGGHEYSGKSGTFRTEAVPGAYTPDYQPRPSYYQQPANFGGHPPYSAPMNFGPPAFFMQVLQNMFSIFSGAY